MCVAVALGGRGSLTFFRYFNDHRESLPSCSALLCPRKLLFALRFSFYLLPAAGLLFLPFPPFSSKFVKNFETSPNQTYTPSSLLAKHLTKAKQHGSIVSHDTATYFPSPRCRSVRPFARSSACKCTSAASVAQNTRRVAAGIAILNTRSHRPQVLPPKFNDTTRVQQRRRRSNKRQQQALVCPSSSLALSSKFLFTVRNVYFITRRFFFAHAPIHLTDGPATRVVLGRGPGRTLPSRERRPRHQCGHHMHSNNGKQAAAYRADHIGNVSMRTGSQWVMSGGCLNCTRTQQRRGHRKPLHWCSTSSSEQGDT